MTTSVTYEVSLTQGRRRELQTVTTADLKSAVQAAYAGSGISLTLAQISLEDLGSNKYKVTVTSPDWPSATDVYEKTTNQLLADILQQLPGHSQVQFDSLPVIRVVAPCQIDYALVGNGYCLSDPFADALEPVCKAEEMQQPAGSRNLQRCFDDSARIKWDPAFTWQFPLASPPANDGTHHDCEAECSANLDCIGYMTETENFDYPTLGPSFVCITILNSDYLASGGINYVDEEKRNHCFEKRCTPATSGIVNPTILFADLFLKFGLLNPPDGTPCTPPTTDPAPDPQTQPGELTAKFYAGSNFAANGGGRPFAQNILEPAILEGLNALPLDPLDPTGDKVGDYLVDETHGAFGGLKVNLWHLTVQCEDRYGASVVPTPQVGTNTASSQCDYNEAYKARHAPWTCGTSNSQPCIQTFSSNLFGRVCDNECLDQAFRNACRICCDSCPQPAGCLSYGDGACDPVTGICNGNCNWASGYDMEPANLDALRGYVAVGFISSDPALQQRVLRRIECYYATDGFKDRINARMAAVAQERRCDGSGPRDGSTELHKIEVVQVDVVQGRPADLGVSSFNGFEGDVIVPTGC